MTNVAIDPGTTLTVDPASHASHNGHGHDPHLAHHFDTPDQQYQSAKLGMWVFLGTEILMFGGLFCAYAVYRHNHYEVFEYAHAYLDKWLGALNTIVLITSSLTMAWAVRSSQLGHQASLRWLLALTILGGYLFLGVKSIEYATKWRHHLFIGQTNKFRTEESMKEALKEEAEERKSEVATEEVVDANTNPVLPAPQGGVADSGNAVHPRIVTDSVSLAPPDPNAGTADQAKIRPVFVDTPGLVRAKSDTHAAELTLGTLKPSEKQRLYTFFGIYFFMTGLHGVHVIVGMSLIGWILLRSLGRRNAAWAVPMVPGSIGLFLAVVGIIVNVNALLIAGLIIAALSVLWALIWVPLRRNASGDGEFGPKYFTPVDLIGLYWHIVDLIWIFLFPLLYLIH